MTARLGNNVDRFTLGFALGAIALCVLAIGSVFLVRKTPPPSLQKPAGVVTAYIQAVRDRDADRAWDLLAPDAAVGPPVPLPGTTTTPRESFRRQMAALTQTNSSSRRIRILDSTEQGETARVTVEVTTASAGPALFGGDSGQTVTFGLKRVDGAWKIESAPPLFEIG